MILRRLIGMFTGNFTTIFIQINVIAGWKDKYFLIRLWSWLQGLSLSDGPPLLHGLLCILEKWAGGYPNEWLKPFILAGPPVV